MKTSLIWGALLTIIFTLTAADINDEYNLLYDAPAWYPATDHFGSAADTGDAFFDQGYVTVDFTLAPKGTTGDWPYIELVCEVGQPLSGTDSIIVSYKCDTTVILKLYQTDLGSEGLQSYALYQYPLSASEDWATVTIAVTDFKQPDWADAASRAVKLNLDHVERIYFTPDLDAQSGGGESTISVKYLSLIPPYTK